jgi:CRISPR-associated protein Cas1
MLRRNADEIEGSDLEIAILKRLISQAEEAESADILLGIEGESARRYWSIFSSLLARDHEIFRMEGRNRRPPRDPSNAMLSFGYALLVKDCTTALHSAGLDPFLGMYHTAHHGRPALALDLMEPFRPLVVDSIVLQMIRRGEVQSDDFIFTGQAVAMKPHARKALLRAYERRMDELIAHPVFGYRISYRQTLSVQARLLARVLLGEIPQLPSFRTR